jgi:hypothetical protein
MTTSRTRALVSLAATMVLITTLGACAGAPPRQALGWGPTEDGSRAIRFDNDGRDYVHIYLVGERREWLLGRVEPGAIAVLRIPADALAEPGLMRLAVITGGRPTVAAGRDARAQLTIALPASHILSRKWWFAQGQVSSLGLPASRAALPRY